MSRSLGRDDDRERPDAPNSESAGPSALSRSGGGEALRARTHNEDDSAEDVLENRRERIRHREREYRIRPSEQKLLSDLGTFRVVRDEDLVKGVYRGNAQLAESDFRSLRAQKLIRTISLQNIRGWKSRVHTLTGNGHSLVLARTSKKSDVKQCYYWGIVKPAEAEHDSLLYRAYLREKDRIKGEGGVIKRVCLDTELKREHYKRTNKPRNSFRRVQAESARELRLPVVEGHVMFPDFRIEYENERGELSRSDVEVATDNYRAEHLGAKLSAGFRVYSASHSAGGGIKAHYGHNLKGHVWQRENHVVLPL